MLSAFGDESFDEGKQRVFAVAALFGNQQTWDALELKWIARTGGVVFHAAECESDMGDFAATYSLASGTLCELHAEPFMACLRVLQESSDALGHAQEVADCATSDRAKALGLERLGLFGTGFTMRASF